MTPSGIEPATFRFVAQHLNHCATAVPAAGVACTYSEYTTGWKVWGTNLFRSKRFFSPLKLPHTASFSMGTSGNSWWLKRQGREVKNLRPFSAEVTASLHPLYSFMTWKVGNLLFFENNYKIYMYSVEHNNLFIPLHL